jgi:hypothetical protein
VVAHEGGGVDITARLIAPTLANAPAPIRIVNCFIKSPACIRYSGCLIVGRTKWIVNNLSKFGRVSMHNCAGRCFIIGGSGAYAISQIEYCRNFIFKRNFPTHKLFERSCELGLWRLTANKIAEIFGNPPAPQAPRQARHRHRSDRAWPSRLSRPLQERLPQAV